MNKSLKILIIVVLIAAVGIVVALKQKKGNPNTKPPAQSNSAPAPALPNNESPIPKLVDLGAGKCIPCKMMAPILEELKKEHQGRLDVIFIDVWEKPDQAKKYKINIIPTQIFYDASGKELFRHEGFFSKEDILAKWKEFGVILEEGKNNETN